MRFIISHDDERYAAFQARFASVCSEPFSLERINLTPETNPVPVPDWWDAAPNRWALLQAILRALRTSAEAKEDCEIYEQDCVFHPEYETRRKDFISALPEDWSMAYLGGQLLALRFYPLEEVPGSEEVLRARNVHRNHAWICRANSTERLAEWLEASRWPSRHTTDWRIGYLQMSTEFPVYIPKKGWICGQGGGLSDLDRIEYPERWWHFTAAESEKEREVWNAFSLKKRKEEERQKFEAWKKTLKSF